MKTFHYSPNGFTLIELSIVLVIIGLIVGGVLVGQNLISAAAVRAQITQIEKFNAAVNSFRGKYDNYLPGDMTQAEASRFGLTTRTGQPGQGDGNGLIEGPNGAQDTTQGGGETGLFWMDLSTTHLIEGSFSSAVATSAPDMTATTVALYMPVAKLGAGNYVYAYDDSVGQNWFGFSSVTSASSGVIYSAAGISVSQAYKIDGKIDDGFPASGNVQAVYVGGIAGQFCGGMHCHPTYSPSLVWSQADSPAASGNGDCYDNTTTQGAYATAIDSGADVTCALSFKFQ